VRRIGPALVLTLCESVHGCGHPAAPASRSAVDSFRRDQANTTTPYGRVLPETATGGPDGSIRYRTEDGRSWKVSATPNAEVGYTYGTPTESR
jgi:hypothetical protein